MTDQARLMPVSAECYRSVAHPFPYRVSGAVDHFGREHRVNLKRQQNSVRNRCLLRLACP